MKRLLALAAVVAGAACIIAGLALLAVVGVWSLVDAVTS